MKLAAKIGIVFTAAVLAFTLTGCEGTTTAAEKDQASTNSQLDRYQKNQPVPASDWSQYRQTVIDVETAQVHGVATTTFFFNMGTDNPIKVCPSIGFPVASTAQLTNPDQVVYGYQSPSVIAQQEPNGVYTGDSSGTYIVCVADNGSKYISYWEGSVHAEGGAAHWDKTQGMITLDGAPTVEATTATK